MARQLPSLSALQAFEAAARHLSVKRAAQELAVTPTAVSHQLRRLEKDLRVRLFHRRPRQLLLTEQGQRLYPVLRDGFDAFVQALRAVHATERRTVVLSATRAFTTHWLLPRLPHFSAHALYFHASEDPIDLRDRTVDIAVRYGPGNDRGLVRHELGKDVFFPVCSPSLGIKTLRQLHAHPLIHFDWKLQDKRTPTWPRWQQTHRIDRRAKRFDLHFSEETVAIAAAMAGQGVALLSSWLVADEIARGILVRPFAQALPGYRYRLVHLPDADVTAVKEWLLREAFMT